MTGWIKRGPTGIIGTNKRDAQETVDACWPIWTRAACAPSEPDRDSLEELLADRRPDRVSYAGLGRSTAPRRPAASLRAARA